MPRPFRLYVASSWRNEEQEQIVKRLRVRGHAAIEAGWFVGAGKPLVILLRPKSDPELMFKMATHLCLSQESMLDAVQQLAVNSEGYQ